jgi:hypothetical protein
MAAFPPSPSHHRLLLLPTMLLLLLLVNSHIVFVVFAFVQDVSAMRGARGLVATVGGVVDDTNYEKLDVSPPRLIAAGVKKVKADDGNENNNGVKEGSNDDFIVQQLLEQQMRNNNNGTNVEEMMDIHIPKSPPLPLGRGKRQCCFPPIVSFDSC